MFARMQELMQWRMSLLLSGRHGDLAREYLYPFPVYTGGRQQVLRGPAEMETALRRLKAIADSTGVVHVEVMVRAIELPRQGRFRVWVSHRDLGTDGAVVGTGQFVHYCRQTETGIKTEMSDYPECRSDWVAQETRRETA